MLYKFVLFPGSQKVIGSIPIFSSEKQRAANTFATLWFLVENIGIEPMTFWLPVKRSSQLS